MRKRDKKKCLELLKTLEEAHEVIIRFIKNEDYSSATSLMAECQNAAISIGSIVERCEGEGRETVKELEDYCETLYIINEEITVEKGNNPSNIEKRLKKEIRLIQNTINALPSRIEAVFMPYNATMWDSLESIWMAADADDDCDAYVVPIPYYDRNPDGSFAKYNYDLDKYPDYVPIINHEEFNLEEHCPDIIFIHNPYDEYNIVTSVHPRYYSYELKKKTDYLVYVPYFATSGLMSEGQSLLSAYYHADYIVVQSREMIEQYDKSIPREKFLPLGSPKFDRVVRLSKNPPESPAEWQERINGKRVYFYNTSIGGMLGDTQVWLDKLKYVFDTFKGVDDVCLLWRPHPLLESSLESMREEYKEKYENIKNYFIEHEIGILDTSPDIEKSIALSDAYIGDAGTSVTSLFGVAGKPVFILNNSIIEPPSKDDWKARTNGVARSDRNDRYCLVMGDHIFEKSKADEKYHYCCSIPDEYRGGGNYGSVLYESGKALIFPLNMENILIMDPKDHSFQRIDVRHEVDGGGAFLAAVNLLFSDHPEVYYLLPNRYPELVKFDAKRERVDYIRDEAFSDEYSVYSNDLNRRIISVRFFRHENGICSYPPRNDDQLVISRQSYREVMAPDGTIHSMRDYSWPDIQGITLKGPKMYCIDKTGKRMRVIQLETGEVQERSVFLDGLYIKMLVDSYEPNVLWFLPYRGTVLVRWDTSQDTWEKVDVAIEGLVSLERPSRDFCEDYFFGGGIFHNGKLILSPNWGNKFVELDTHTYTAREWVPPFYYSTDDKNRYWKNTSVGFFFRDVYDYSVKFYYAQEHILYDIDLDNNTAVAKEYIYDRNEILDLSMGFHKNLPRFPYGCSEDLLNPLNDFIKNEAHGASFDKASQTEAYASINASPEGDCGEKVFNYLKKVL